VHTVNADQKHMLDFASVAVAVFIALGENRAGKTHSG
jgi:hypothetical protein